MLMKHSKIPACKKESASAGKGDNEKQMQKPDAGLDILADRCFYCGIFFMSSVIFLMRNLSVLSGIWLPFSGNAGLKYHSTELWRYAVFALAAGCCMFLASKIHNMHPAREKIKSYILYFLSGAGAVLAAEWFLWRLAAVFSS